MLFHLPYPFRLFRLSQLVVAILCVLIAATHAEDQGKNPEKESDKDEVVAKTVSLVIDYGDGAKLLFPAIPWKEEMNIRDLLDFASQHRHGVTFKSRGKGATALLYRIDDLENEGGSGLNWIFRVNGKLGDRSFAITPLAANDRVLWKFDEYR